MDKRLKFIETIENSSRFSDFDELHVFDTGIVTLQALACGHETQRVRAQQIYASLFSTLDDSDTTAMTLFIELLGGNLLLVDQWMSSDGDIFLDATIARWKANYKLSHIVVSPVEGDESDNYLQNHPLRRYLSRRCPDVLTSAASKLHVATARLDFFMIRKDEKLSLAFFPGKQKLLQQLQRKIQHPLALSALQGVDSRPKSPFFVEYAGPLDIKKTSVDDEDQRFNIFEDYDELRQEANQLRAVLGLKPYQF